MSSRANLAASTATGRSDGMSTSTSVRNRFTGVVTAAPSSNAVVAQSATNANPSSDMRKASVAASASTGVSTGSKFGGGIRSSVSQGLGRAEAARQTRLQEIKARTKAALAGFGSQRNVSASTTTSSALATATASMSPRKPLPPQPTTQISFSPSVMQHTIASLNRATTPGSSTGSASASLPMLSAIAQTPSLTTLVTGGLQRAATVHAGVGKMLTPCLTPRSSSLRHLRRVMRKQAKEADLEHERVVAAENIAPGAVVPSVIVPRSKEVLGLTAKPSIRTVATVGRSTSPMKTVSFRQVHDASSKANKDEDGSWCKTQRSTCSAGDEQSDHFGPQPILIFLRSFHECISFDFFSAARRRTRSASSIASRRADLTLPSRSFPLTPIVHPFIVLMFDELVLLSSLL